MAQNRSSHGQTTDYGPVLQVQKETLLEDKIQIWKSWKINLFRVAYILELHTTPGSEEWG